MTRAKEREEFFAALAAACPDIPRARLLAIGRKLCTLSRAHAQIAEDQCNGPGDYVNRIPYPAAGEIYREWEERCELREKKTEERIVKLAEQLPGVRVRFGGDPRGYTVALHLPTGASNSWGGKEYGYGVPQ